jgi:MFS family permease
VNYFRAISSQRTVALLVLCQVLAATSLTLLFTVMALVGAALAEQRSLATLPVALLQLSVMAATIPASLLMQQIGRRWGFLVGTLIGIGGASLGAAAIFNQSFGLFCLAASLIGVFNGFTSFYRFAAADVAQESFRAQAISLVVAAGVVAAIAGPNLATLSKDWFDSATYAGALVVMVGLQGLTIPLLLATTFPPTEIAPLPKSEFQWEAKPERSPLGFAQQATFRVAVLGSMVGYGVMALLMTATPLAMVASDYPFAQAASVLQWHVLGMFAPSFITGALIARLGVLKIVLMGVLLNLLCVAVNLTGQSLWHFHLALTLLGIGWNFMFVGSTTLLTETYIPAEKAQAQAIHDFCMYAFVALATFLSGRLLNDFGWATVNWVTLPVLALAAIAAWRLQQSHR